MRNFLWIIVAALIAFGGYLLYSGQSVEEIATDAATAVESYTGTNDGSATDQ